MTGHPILPSCVGESCTICGAQAHHKVGEEFLDGQGDLEPSSGYFNPHNGTYARIPTVVRHNLTAYLCCGHFRQVMGGSSTPWCPVVIEEVR